MLEGLHRLNELRERLKMAALPDHSQHFNTMRVEALELDNLMAVACATANAALYRQESRGAHSREDFPEGDNERWLVHSLYYEHQDTMGVRGVNFKPTKVEAFAPKKREY